MKDVWNVDMVGRTSSERNGYATQKPLELMRRIIEAGSREGDLTGDFFCGSGSFAEAAEAAGRKWVGCDNEKLAVSLARKRLINAGATFDSYDVNTSGTEGRIDIEVRESLPLENGGRMLKLAVTDFVPDIDTGYIQKNDRIYIETALKNDPVQLIDYIMADNDYRDTFECRTMIEDISGEIVIVSSGKVRLIAVDVFGREYDDIFTMIVLVVVVVMVVIVCMVMVMVMVMLMLMIVVMVMTVHLGMFVIMVMHFGVT